VDRLEELRRGLLPAMVVAVERQWLVKARRGHGGAMHGAQVVQHHAASA
jgi:hypothetical protein